MFEWDDDDVVLLFPKLGPCTATTADCVVHGSSNCSADPHCHSFSVRSDCSTQSGAPPIRWMSHREGCNSTVPNQQWVTYSRLGAPPCPPAPPPTPPAPPTPPPLLPTWNPTWDMMRSTMLYTCNHSGFHNATYAAQFGVVSYDWSNAKEVCCQPECHPYATCSLTILGVASYDSSITFAPPSFRLYLSNPGTFPSKTIPQYFPI